MIFLFVVHIEIIKLKKLQKRLFFIDSLSSNFSESTYLNDKI